MVRIKRSVPSKKSKNKKGGLIPRISDGPFRFVNKVVNKGTGELGKFFKGLEKKKEAAKQLPLVVSMIDKLAKNNIIHDNKAANLKSKLTKYLNSL